MYSSPLLCDVHFAIDETPSNRINYWSSASHAMIDFGIDAPYGKRDAIDDGDPNPRGESLAHLSIIFVSLAGFFVILRMITRYFHTKAWGADDVLIVAALVRDALLFGFKH